MSCASREALRTHFSQESNSQWRNDGECDSDLLQWAENVPEDLVSKLGSLEIFLSIEELPRHCYEREQHERDEQRDEEDRKLRIVGEPWRIPAIETLQQRHQKHYHPKEDGRELDKMPHAPSVQKSPVLNTPIRSSGWGMRRPNIAVNTQLPLPEYHRNRTVQPNARKA